MLSACSAAIPDGPLSAGSFSLASVTSYSPANAIVTTGYSDREFGEGQFRVRAKGSSVTPPSRLEKIALARAAEIGVEQQLKFFKPGPFAHSVTCKDAKVLPHKSGKVAADISPVVELDVVYAKDTVADPGFLPAAETFTRLTGELATEAVDADVKSAAAAAVAAKCGK